MATLPEPPFKTGRRSPWGRLEAFRRKFDRVVFTLIDKAEADPNLDERSDILALLLRSRYEDGTAMSRQDVSDELLTLLGAAFANTEMDVVLRTVLQHFRIETDDAPDEKVHHRGVAYTPKDGGRVVVNRRK